MTELRALYRAVQALERTQGDDLADPAHVEAAASVGAAAQAARTALEAAASQGSLPTGHTTMLAAVTAVEAALAWLRALNALNARLGSPSYGVELLTMQAAHRGLADALALADDACRLEEGPLGGPDLRAINYLRTFARTIHDISTGAEFQQGPLAEA
jgi:hypothetical protein